MNMITEEQAIELAAEGSKVLWVDNRGLRKLNEFARICDRLERSDVKINRASGRIDIGAGSITVFLPSHIDQKRHYGRDWTVSNSAMPEVLAQLRD